MIRNMWLLAAGVVAAGLLGGCLDVDQQILVRGDGSGTVTQTVYVSKEFAQQMAAMAQSNGEAPPAADAPNPIVAQMMDPTKLKEQASEMGEGVQFDSVKAIKAKDGREGFRALFKFADITKVKMPVGDAPEMGPGEKEAAKPAVTFAFTVAKGGAPAKLVLSLPQPKPEPAAAEPEDPNAEGMMAMMMQFMKDLRMRLSVKVDGTVTAIDATYAEKDKGEMTVMKIDMASLNKDTALASKMPDVLKALKSPAQLKALLVDPNMKGIDKHVQYEPKETVTIEFKPKAD